MNFNNIDKPNHYEIIANDDIMEYETIEAIDVIKAVLTEDEYLGYCQGNMLKYLLRSKKKGGAEDLRKSCKYAEFMREVLDAD